MPPRSSRRNAAALVAALLIVPAAIFADIEVFDPVFTPIASGGSYNHGITESGTPLLATFTIRNPASALATVNLTGTGPTLPTGWSLLGGYGTTLLAPGTSTTFDVSFDAAAPPISQSGAMVIDSDDTLNPSYSITLQGVAVPGVLLVDDTSDVSDGDYSPARLSFREAIELANTFADTNTIRFAPSVFHVAPTSPLPSIVQRVVIDALGGGCTPTVYLDGTGAGVGANGLELRAGNSRVEGLAIGRFSGAGILITSASNEVYCCQIGIKGAVAEPNGIGVHVSVSAMENRIGLHSRGNTISGNLAQGVLLDSGGAGSATVVQGNIIGLDSTGTAIVGNGAAGVEAVNEAVGTYIGADLSGAANPDMRNVIGGNAGPGILVRGGTDVAIASNLIGVMADGTTLASNTIGVQINGSADSCRIGTNGDGTSDDLEGNVIVSNTAAGISISGPGGNHWIAGNLIGVDAAGTSAPASGGTIGISIDNSPGNLMGTNFDFSSDGFEGNTISGWADTGIRLTGALTVSTKISGNRIGTDASGIGAIGNGNNGIRLGAVGADTMIGGPDRSEGNIISASGSHGIQIAATAAGGYIIQNKIGTDSSTTRDFGNGGAGIRIDSSDWLIGLPGNIIINNDLAGIQVGSGAVRVQMTENRIYSNGGLGIDLGDDGVTLNDATDADTGANDLLNFPVIGEIPTGSATVDGTVQGAPFENLVVEVFRNSVADPTGYGEGFQMVGSTVATTNAAGSANFSAAIAGVATIGDLYSATVTDSLGNTSEFSGVHGVADPAFALAVTSLDPSPSNAASVRWAATFDSVVTGVDVADFFLHGDVPDAAVTSVTEPYGTALLFDGVSGALTIPTFNGLPQTLFTVDAWVFPTQNKPDNVIVEHEWPAAGGWRLALDASGAPGFSVADGTTSATATAPALALNRWYHVAGTYDGSRVRIYVDAVQGSAASLTTLLDNTGTVTISSPTAAFAGAIDEVHLWRRALDALQVGQRRENLPTGLEGFVVGNFGGNTFVDLGVNADGTDDIADASASANHADASGGVKRISWPWVTVSTGTVDGGITADVIDNGTIQSIDGGGLDGPLVGETIIIDRTGPSVTIANVVPDPRNAGVPSFTITFDDVAQDFTLADLNLSLNGGPNMLAGSETLTSPDGFIWTLSDLSFTTDLAGDFELEVLPGGITDALGNPLTVGASETWHRNAAPTAGGPVVVNVAEDTPSAVVDLFALFADAEDADTSMSYTVELNNNVALATATAVDGTLGTLTITIAPNTIGTALITVRARDTNGLYVDSVVTLNVSNGNDAPTDMALAGASISEAAGIGVPIGTFSTTDPDNPGAGQTFTYTLLTGGVPLAISGDILVVNGPLNATTNPTYTIRVRTTDSGVPPLSYEEDFLITILGSGGNNTPTDIITAPNPVQVAENSPLTTQVAALTTQDPDNPGAGQTFTYTLITAGTPFSISGSNLVVSGSIDYEMGSVYTLRIRTTDNGAPPRSFEEDITVQVLDVNEAPTAVAMSNTLHGEHSPNGTFVSTLSSTDPDVGQSHIYSIAYDESGGGFGISGSTLVVADQTKIDYERDRHVELFIRTRDNGTPQLIYTQYLVVDIGDQNDPPSLTRNQPLWVVRNQTNTFNSSRLEIQDPDSSLGVLYYILDSVPTQGRLMLNGSPLGVSQLFTQLDINSGDLQYVHDDVNPVLVDGFDFHNSDGNITLTTPEHFTIYVTYANTPPTLTTSSGITAPFQQESYILQSQLRLVDAEQSPHDLTYIVTGLPAHGQVLRNNVPLLTGGFFTQQDLQLSMVTYRHTDTVGGGDSFTFTYTDNIVPSALGPQNFPITVGVATNTAPYVNSLATLNLQVVAGTSATIYPQVFEVLDNEQAPRFRNIRIVSAPGQGRINLSSGAKSVVGTGGTFTQDDVNNGRISYVHDNTTLGTDSFLVQFDDGIVPPSTPVLVNVTFITRVQDWKSY